MLLENSSNWDIVTLKAYQAHKEQNFLTITNCWARSLDWYTLAVSVMVHFGITSQAKHHKSPSQYLIHPPLLSSYDQFVSSSIFFFCLFYGDHQPPNAFYLSWKFFLLIAFLLIVSHRARWAVHLAEPHDWDLRPRTDARLTVSRWAKNYYPSLTSEFRKHTPWGEAVSEQCNLLWPLGAHKNFESGYNHILLLLLLLLLLLIV